jgi:hypothetical protein
MLPDPTPASPGADLATEPDAIPGDGSTTATNGAAPADSMPPRPRRTKEPAGSRGPRA